MGGVWILRNEKGINNGVLTGLGNNDLIKR